MNTTTPHLAIKGHLGDHPFGRLTIDLDALAKNFRRLRDLASPAECAAVVKADAYGLGAVEVCSRLFLEGCRNFFVAQVDEAILLKQAEIPGFEQARICVLGGLAGAPASLFDAFDLIPVLSTLEEIDQWSQAAHASQAALPAIIQIDSGMHRLGLAPKDVQTLANEPSHLEGVSLIAVMSHLACADDSANEQNQAQLRTFKAASSAFPAAPLSLANSAGVFLGPAYHFDLVRPGIALYGGNPMADGSDADLSPVVHLEARVLQTRTIDAGAPVGYGAAFRAETARACATLGVGYGDGYLRCLGNRADAFVAGQRCPVIGRVSMDLTTIDTSALSTETVKPGDWVELMGAHITLDELATHAKTIGYELLTALGPRYARHYKGLPSRRDETR